MATNESSYCFDVIQDPDLLQEEAFDAASLLRLMRPVLEELHAEATTVEMSQKLCDLENALRIAITKLEVIANSLPELEVPTPAPDERAQAA